MLKEKVDFLTKRVWVFYYLLSIAREAELRRLRKANVEFEEQNSILQKHIAEMFNAKERLEAELGQDELRTQALHRRLQAIKQTLVTSLASVPLPGQSVTMVIVLKHMHSSFSITEADITRFIYMVTMW